MKVARIQIQASDLVKAEPNTPLQGVVQQHPLTALFVKWLGGKVPTKRKAQEFLNQYPQYREMKRAG